MCTLKSLEDRQTPLGWVLRVLSILSELTDQTIPVAMIMFLLIKPAGSLIEDLRDSKIPWACTMQAYIWGGGGRGGREWVKKKGQNVYKQSKTYI